MLLLLLLGINAHELFTHSKSYFRYDILAEILPYHIKIYHNLR